MVTRRGKQSSKRIRTGIAIGPAELIAVDVRLRIEGAFRAPLELPPLDGGAWPSLAAALRALAETLGVTNGTLAVSLLPPLSEVRRLDLPPLGDEDLHRLLSRNAAKYFVGAKSQQLIGTSRTVRGARGATGGVVAAAASARLVAAIHVAAQQSGWTIETIAPAEAAWAAAGTSLWPSFARKASCVLVAHAGHTDLLQLDDGRLAGVRRLGPGAFDADTIIDAVGPNARLGIEGGTPQRRVLSAALAARGVSVTAPVGEWSSSTETTDVLAAHFAGSGSGPVLRGEENLALDRAQVRRATWTLGAAAAVILVLAATVQLWGVRHQLSVVRAERAKLRPQIASTLVGRTTVDAAYRSLASLTAAERQSAQWSSLIAKLSESIPDDAYLTAIRARQDSLIVDGLAAHAARVFDALEKTAGLANVQSASPVRRELQQDGAALEHFTIAARVVGTNGHVLPTPASNPVAPRSIP